MFKHMRCKHAVEVIVLEWVSFLLAIADDRIDLRKAFHDLLRQVRPELNAVIALVGQIFMCNMAARPRPNLKCAGPRHIREVSASDRSD